MARDDGDLSGAKRAYRSAKTEGNRAEEARWANVIGDLLKNRGEYVEALKWLRIDYDISSKYLAEKQLLPSCQSLGEVLLRLQDFRNALIYQKKHLELAKDADDLIEQQRANTQLGRTYYDMFLVSDNDHFSARNAKKYFKSAMKLAEMLRENPPTTKSSFLKEYIDAHNNIGMLEFELDNFEEAEKILTRGLEICDEEEINENDDGRSRLHHNLGIVYLDMRLWDKAREHIEKDIIICKSIEHCQGEAKGYVNLGELHYRVQKYEEAIRCYEKAFDLAKSMEDEDALVKQIDQNIEIVREAMKVMDELKKEEQNLKKLRRIINNARGTPHERKYLLKQNASLDILIEKSSMIFAWLKHREFAKRKKRTAAELCDKEKLSDSFLAIGESYQKLRKFDKSIKWFTKSWEAYKSIGNLEGQALAKINIGAVLDCVGDWTGALNAFEEGCRIAVEASLPSVQLEALENMHYSHMIRFDNVEEARNLQLEIDNLKQSIKSDLESKNMERDCCPETDTEDDDCLSDSRSNASLSMEFSKAHSTRSKSLGGLEELKDDMPLISFLWSSKHLSKKKTVHKEKNSTSVPTEASPKCLSKTTTDQQSVVGRKRVRVVLSDDEGEMNDEVDCSKDGLQKCPIVDVATSDEYKRKNNPVTSTCKSQDVSSKCATGSFNPVNIEESTCSYKTQSPKVVTPTGKAFRSSSSDEVAFACDFAASGSKCAIDVSENLVPKQKAANLILQNSVSQNKQHITFRIDNDLMHVEAGAYEVVDMMNIDSMKVELACLYYLQLPTEKRSKGLLPIIQHMKCAGRVLDSLEAFGSLRDDFGNILIEVYIDGWVQKRLMKLYLDCCKELLETPNMKLLKKLYISEVEDEVIASECELQDISITPLLDALHTHKTVAMIDLSHNLLGNGTMEKLQQFFTSAQKYGDLTLDLHCNRFGPTALFQICECPVLFTRLEVLNVSGNHLTDACGSYLSTILENCKALYSLNIERCSVTSRTIQKVAEALSSTSVLSQLCIGYNSPMSGNAIINLLTKLANLKSFVELNLNGLKLNKPVVDSICHLAESTCLSRLMLGSSGIGTDGALKLTESLFRSSQESVKLDLSYCGLTDLYLHKLNTDVACSIIELNLGGNLILQEGRNALASLLTNPQSCLKIMILNNCQLGVAGVLQMIQAVAENTYLEELHLADNVDLDRKNVFPYDQMAKWESDILQPNLIVTDTSPKMCAATEPHTTQQGLGAVNTNQLEVADSEDDPIMAGCTPFELDDSCTSSCQKNSSLGCRYFRYLSTAIGMTKHLQLLDLSNNGFSTEAADALYAAWSNRLGAASAWRHIKDQIIHFSVETNKCCRLKPCCRRD